MTKEQDKELMRMKKAERKKAARAEEQAASRARAELEREASEVESSYRQEMAKHTMPRQVQTDSLPAAMREFPPGLLCALRLVGSVLPDLDEASRLREAARRDAEAQKFWRGRLKLQRNLEVLSTDPFRVQAYHNQSGFAVDRPGLRGRV